MTTAPPTALWGDWISLPENRSAGRAVTRLARTLAAGKRPAAAFAPLLLHGPPGTGKTHLAAALVRAVSDRSAGRTARVEVAADLAQPDADADPDDLPAADLLVLEDLHRLPPRAADRVCRLLDIRAARRRPTLVTAAAGPAGLIALPRRLTSRLAAGLVVELRPLSAGSRKRVLTVLAAARRLRLTADARAWLADHPTGGGLRPLLGMLESLKALAAGRLDPLDAAAVRALLATADVRPEPTDAAGIAAKAAAAFGVKPKELLGPSRLRSVLLARQAAMWLARHAGGLSLAKVGAAFGGRDHSTVLHAIRKVDERAAADPAFAATLARLRAELG